MFFWNAVYNLVAKCDNDDNNICGAFAMNKPPPQA